MCSRVSGSASLSSYLIMLNADVRAVGDFIYNRKQWLERGDNSVIIICGHGILMRTKLIL